MRHTGRCLPALLLAILPVAAMAIEQPRYEVVQRAGDVEVRRYASYLVAETWVDGGFEAAGNEGFGRLFRYITGANQAQSAISMTAPVSQQPASGTDIAMTAPVTQAGGEGGYWIAFMVPSGYTLETVPRPTDPRVRIREVPAVSVAAYRYSGFWGEDRYRREEQRLREAIGSLGLTVDGPARFARYNPPYMPPFMRRNEILLPLAGAYPAATLALSACGSDDDVAAAGSGPPAAAKLALRVLHASPDAPAVNILVNGAAALGDVDYKDGSAFLSLDAGTYDLAVEAITPAGNAVVIDLPGTALAADTDYSVIAIGKVADASLTALVLDSATAPIASGQLRARVVHASPDAPAVDVYVTAPGADLGTATPLATLAFGEDAGPVTIPAGDYQIRIATPGMGGSVVFDSGTVTLPAGADLLVAAVNNTTTGSSPVSLVVNTGSTTFPILDAWTPAAVRVGHLSADAPAVDVVVNDAFASPAVSALVFPTVTGYLDLAPGTYNFKVVDNASQSLTAIDADLTLAAGTRYSVLAVNDLANIEPLVLTGDPRPIATEARVRIVHAAPTAGPVDIYVTAPGTDITTVPPAFAGVPLKGDTGFVGLAPGSYDIKVTPAGDPLTVAIAVDALPLAGGDVITAIARDQAGGGAPLGLVVIDETT